MIVTKENAEVVARRMCVNARNALPPVKAVTLPRVPLAANAPLAIELCEVVTALVAVISVPSMTWVRFLQEQDWHVPQALLRVPVLKEPSALPRFLTDEQIVQVRDSVEQRVCQATTAAYRRDALLDRAAFYIMWQGGLRVGEVEELRLEDLDLPARKLMVRQGKGRRDRAIFLTDSAVLALHEYLAVRGPGPSDHVLLYRAEPVEKDLIRSRIRYAGQRVGVKVSPHMLRHTFGTQLVNAACPITTIQKLLGHRDLSSTLIYARVHDRTVADDYYAAMARIEQELAPKTHPSQLTEEQARARLLKLARQLAQPRLAQATRQDLLKQIRRVVKTEMRPMATA